MHVDRAGHARLPRLQVALQTPPFKFPLLPTMQTLAKQFAVEILHDDPGAAWLVCAVDDFLAVTLEGA